MAKWRAEHPEETKEKNRIAGRKFRQAHPDLVRAKCLNEVAAKRNAIGSYSASDIALILDAQDYRCYYCDEVLDQSYHVDHKQPTSRGGSNWPENLAVTCPHCNLSKNAQTEAEFVLRQFAGSGCST